MQKSRRSAGSLTRRAARFFTRSQKKVPQGADDAGSDSDDDDDVDVTGGDVVDPMMVELKRRLGFMRRKEAQKVHPLKKPEARGSR